MPYEGTVAAGSQALLARPCRAQACGIIASARWERQEEEANVFAAERLNDVATHCGHCIVERTKLAAVAKTNQRARAPARACAGDARDACLLRHALCAAAAPRSPQNQRRQQGARRWCALRLTSRRAVGVLRLRCMVWCVECSGEGNCGLYGNSQETLRD